MYLEIFDKTVAKYLPKYSKVNIDIELTNTIYNKLIEEINQITKFNTTVPIEYISVSSIKIHNKTVGVIKGETLDPVFEETMIEMMELLKFNAL